MAGQNPYNGGDAAPSVGKCPPTCGSTPAGGPSKGLPTSGTLPAGGPNKVIPTAGSVPLTSMGGHPYGEQAPKGPFKPAGLVRK